MLVVWHDGDDGVVDEEAKGQDPGQAGERTPENAYFRLNWQILDL